MKLLIALLMLATPAFADRTNAFHNHGNKAILNTITSESAGTPVPTATAVPTATPIPAPTLVPTATPIPAPTLVPTATPQPAGSGDVAGPGSSFDNSITRFNGTTGKIIQDNGSWFITDAGELSGTASTTANNFMMTINQLTSDGEFLETRNFNDNEAHQLRQNNSGDALMRVYMNSGNVYALIQDGVMKIGDTTGDIITTVDLLIDDGGGTAAGGGTLGFRNDTLDVITLKAPSGAFTDYNLTLPTTDGATNEFLQTNGSGVLTWAAGGGGSGDVVGPTGALNNAITRYDTTTGKLVQDSLTLLDDLGRITFPNATTAGAVFNSSQANQPHIIHWKNATGTTLGYVDTVSGDPDIGASIEFYHEDSALTGNEDGSLVMLYGGTISTPNSMLQIRHITGSAAWEDIAKWDDSGNFTQEKSGSEFNLAVASLMVLPQSATPTLDAVGEFVLDTTVADFSYDILKYHGGEELGIVAMPIAEYTTPANGDVIAYNSTNDEFELVPHAGHSTAFQTLTDAANIAWNLANGVHAKVTLGGNRTLDTPSNLVEGARLVIIVTSDGTVGRTLAFSADYLFGGGIAPTKSSAANSVDYFSFIVNDASKMIFEGAQYDVQ